MREIKFRAWINTTMFRFGLKDSHHYRWDEDKLMQYTGLKDKNGKEIYEGDIVEFKSEDGGGLFIIQRAEVRWCLNNTAMMIEPFTWQVGGCYPNDCEVIGNIYENPELLENK